ncbi:MAG: DUF4440 domain-containing protein [Woeseiaceae bacterium]|nr:DUF4440 domain-containing protein [Woeseiaceae bacterium]
MKKLLTLLAALCLGTSVFASESEVEIIRAQLHEIAWMSAKDRPVPEMAEEYMTYFSAEPTLLPPNSEAIVGRDSIEEFYTGAFGGVRLISNRYYDEEIVVIGDMASRHYFGTAHLSFPGDASEVMSINRYVDVLVKEDGEWRMAWHSWVPVTWDRDGSAELKKESKSMSGGVPSFQLIGNVR